MKAMSASLGRDAVAVVAVELVARSCPATTAGAVMPSRSTRM